MIRSNYISSTENKSNVAVIGGGTGIYPVLQGLKKYHKELEITAIISMADSGGSTGRLRDEFGQLPVGDVRMALTALASEVDAHEDILRQLFLYRFDKGDGLHGHNFGNLLIVALTEILGSEAEAVKVAARILRVRGRVVPVTVDKVDLVALYDDGEIVRGEHGIDEPSLERHKNRITNFYTEPSGQIYPDARKAILEADLILLGPGDLYTSLLANCVIKGVRESIIESKALFVYASNLMTKPGQTQNMTASDHVREVEKYLHKMPDVTIVNTGEIPPHLLERYAKTGQYPVLDDSKEITKQTRVIKEDLLSRTEVIKNKSDVLQRSLVRGDGDKMASLIMSLI